MEIGNLTRLKCLLEKAECDQFLDGMTLHEKVSHCIFAQRKKEKLLSDCQTQVLWKYDLQDMKETKFDRLLQRCCNSSKTGRPKTISPLLPPNNHFYSPHTNHQRTWPIQSSIIQTHSTAPHAQKYPKQSLTNSLNYLQVIVFFLVMCLLKSACAEIPHRCLQEFTFLDCGTQLVTRWTYDSVNMQCKDNIEWPCEEYDDTTNSFDTLQECNRVCLNHIHDDTPSPPSGEAGPMTLAPIVSSDQPSLAPVEVCFEPPRQMFCENFFPPVTHYFYNPETDECEDFSFFNCGSFGNNFESLETCIATCRDRLRATTESPAESTTSTEIAETECLLSQPPPSCNDSCPMECFHFNTESSQCESFRAFNCNGSFSSEESCIATCYNSTTTTTTHSEDTTQQPSDTPPSHVTTPSDHVTSPSESVTTETLPTTEEIDGTHIVETPTKLSLLDFASVVLAVLAVGLVVLLIVVVGVVKYKYRMAMTKKTQEMIEIKRKSISSFNDKHRHHHSQRHSQTRTSCSRTITCGDIV